MSAKIGLLKSNIIKNKSTKLFFKTMSSKFFHKAKSPMIMTDVTWTKSTTKFSDNNLTKTMPSSKYKEEPLFMSLQDFHKKFILNKTNSFKIDYQTNCNSDKKKKVINLRKYSFSPSFNSSSTENNMQRNNIKTKTKNNQNFNKTHTNSFFKFYNKNEENKEGNGKTTNIFNRKKKIYYTNNLKTMQNNQIQSELFDSEIKKNNKIIRNSHIFKMNNNFNNKDFFSSREKDINNEIHFKNKGKDEKIKLYYDRNAPKIIDKFAYPNYHFSERIETLKEFYYKTKINIFNNYRKYLNQNTYLKHEVKVNFEIEREILRERNIQNFEKLYAIYKKSLEEYIQFLHRKYREIQDLNESLIKNKFKMKFENEKIKSEIIRGMNKIREGFNVKYFLTCVKNHTLSPEKFSPEDYKEIQQERLKLNENYYISLIRKKKKRNSYRRPNVSNIFLNNNQVQRLQEHSLTRKEKANNYLSGKNMTNINDKIIKNFSKRNTQILSISTIPKSFRVIDTFEEFIEHMDSLSSSVYNLIIDSTNKYYRNVFLKLELEKISKKSTNQMNHFNYFQGKISLYEKTLHDLKSKNSILISNLNNLKEHRFQSDIKFLVVMKYIQKIYFNIKRENNSIINIKKEMAVSYNDNHYLKLIEQFLCKLLLKINNIKKRNPHDYKILKAKLNKLQKERDFNRYQKLLFEKVQIKIEKVLQKAEKVIFKRYRIINDYKKVHKISKIKKKEIKKTDLEIFEEYLDDESF